MDMGPYQNLRKQTAFFLTLVFPFAGLVYTLSHWRESWAKNTFWLACIYLGAVLIYWPEGTILGVGHDGGRYVLQLMEMHRTKVSLESIIGAYSVEHSSMDLYFPLVGYLVSRFTENGHCLFAVFAFVFGYFYSRNIWYILEKIQDKKLGSLVILVVLFFLINPITHINGVRYNTAIHVFVYALLPYLLDNDRSKLWWLIAVPFIHFSFFYVSIFGLLYVVLPKGSNSVGKTFLLISVLIFCVSLLVNSINMSSVKDLLTEYSPESFEERINDYVDQEVSNRLSEANAKNNWYVGASSLIKYWCYCILSLLLYPCFKRNSTICYQYRNLYAFSLLFGSLANIMALIPSGGRFYLVSQMFMVSLILLVSVRIPVSDIFKRALSFSLLLLVMPMVVDIRKLFDYFSITAILGNFITVFLWDYNVPLIQYIK